MNVLRDAHPGQQNLPAIPTEVPSRHQIQRTLPAAISVADPRRVRFRLRLLWEDTATRSRRREELIAFARPDRLLDLLDKVRRMPHRRLLNVTVEAMPPRRWHSVSLDYVAWQVQYRSRRGVGGAR